MPDSAGCIWRRRSGLYPCDVRHLKKKEEIVLRVQQVSQKLPKRIPQHANSAANCTFVLLVAAFFFLSLNRAMREKYSHGNSPAVAHLTVAFFNFINNEGRVILCVCVSTSTSPVTGIVT